MCSLLLLRRGGSLGIGLGRAEDANYLLVVPLLTRPLKDWLHGSLETNHGGPGLSPDGRVVDGYFILDRVGRNAREPFHQVQIFPRSHEVTFGGKVRGVDDQSFAVPPASRVAGPLAD